MTDAVFLTAEKVAVERDDHLGEIELVSGYDRLSIGEHRAGPDAGRADRLEDVPPRLGHDRSQSALAADRGMVKQRPRTAGGGPCLSDREPP